MKQQIAIGFTLYINEHVVCRRLFSKKHFENCSFSSVDLCMTINRCVQIIHEDLLSKSNAYTHCVAPSIFRNMVEMELAIKNKKTLLKIGDYIYVVDNQTTYIWDGECPIKTERIDFVEDFVNPIKQTSEILRFTFGKYNENKEVAVISSQSWSADAYPVYVRRNIDLLNKQPFRYDSPTTKRENLVELIINELKKCLTSTSKY